MECDEAMALALEALINTHLSTYKTQVWNGDDVTRGFNFNATIHGADERIPVESMDFGTQAIHMALSRYSG